MLNVTKSQSLSPSRSNVLCHVNVNLTFGNWGSGGNLFFGGKDDYERCHNDTDVNDSRYDDLN